MDCVQRIKKLRAKLFHKAVGAYTMMGGLPIELDESIGTFATDGKKILVNEAFATTLSDKEVKGVIIHEALHVSNLHHTRRKDIHPTLWNEGADMLINQWIRESANYGTDFVLPEGAITWPDNHPVLNSTFDGGVERICQILLAEGWEPPPEDKDGSGPPQRGCGEILDAPECDHDVQDIMDVEQEIMERVAEASLMEKSMGQGSAGMVTKVKNTKVRGARALSMMKRWLMKSMSSHRSFKRPNKKWLSKNILVPTREKQAKVLYGVFDSSASMGMKDFESARSTLVETAKHLKLNKIMIAYVDTSIHLNPKTQTPWFEYHLNSGRGADALELDVFGGGGTSFTPIFDWIRDNNHASKVGALVYFTDGFGEVECKPPPYPVLWATTYQAPWYRWQGKKKVFGTVVEI